MQESQLLSHFLALFEPSLMGIRANTCPVIGHRRASKPPRDSLSSDLPHIEQTTYSCTGHMLTEDSISIGFELHCVWLVQTQNPNQNAAEDLSITHKYVEHLKENEL